MARRIALVISVWLWLAVVSFGVGWLWSYNHAAGAAARPPDQWPASSSVARVAGRPLVMSAHPKCPCSQASVEELSKLMANCQGQLDAYVLFVIPRNASPDWYQTDLWNSAARIPAVRVVIDQAGAEASRFGALTSGQVLLYDGNGELSFAGGITQSRGHSGDNAGRSAIESLVNRAAAEIDHSQVFGCPLFNPEECPIPNREKASK